MSDLSFRGGARIGWSNASWPFAKLSINIDRLTLASLGSYEFTPDQVVSVERYGSIPLLSSGIRINHNRADYPETLVFWCMGGREQILVDIQRSGFLPKGEVKERAPGIPFRWSVIIGVIVLWNALFSLGRSPARLPSSGPGPLAFLALVLMLCFVTAVKLSPRLQRLVLSPGHQIGEVKSFLVLLQTVSGFLSLVFGAMWLGHAIAG